MSNSISVLMVALLKYGERSKGRGVVALLTHTWPFLTLQELWLLPLVLIAPRQSGAFLLLLSWRASNTV